MSEITKELIEKASYQTLISYCPKLNVKYEYQKKEPLRELLLKAFTKSKNKKTNSTADNRKAKYGSKVIRIIDNTGMSKADKMRSLYNLGIQSPAEISRLTNAHYSYVFTVINKYRKE